MAERARRGVRPDWWRARPGHRAETLGIALMIHLLMVVTLAVGYRVYLAGLAAVSPPDRLALWLFRPGEAGLALALGLAAGGWLAGVWLGERRPHDWGGLSLLAALMAWPFTQGLYGLLGLAQGGERFAFAGLVPATIPWIGHLTWLLALLIGALAGAWWAGLTPPDQAEQV
jgi:hypothetical protein